MSLETPTPADAGPHPPALHAQTLVWLHLADAPRADAPYHANPDVGLIPAAASRSDLAAAKAELARLEGVLAGAPGSDAPPDSLLDRIASGFATLSTELVDAALQFDLASAATATSSALYAAALRSPARAAQLARHYGASRNPALLPHLLLVVAGAPLPARRGAIDGLGALGDPRGTDALVQALLTDPEPFNARNAAFALVRVAQPPYDTARAALEQARDRGAPMVQRAATEALAKLGVPAP